MKEELKAKNERIQEVFNKRSVEIKKLVVDWRHKLNHLSKVDFSSIVNEKHNKILTAISNAKTNYSQQCKG